MIKYMNEIPEFYIEVTGNVYHTEKFHERIIELIQENLSGESNETKLCTLIAPDGTIMTADLPHNAYKQSLQKSLEFYIENENYKMCTKIKNIIEQL
jgi:hypothetical protein